MKIRLLWSRIFLYGATPCFNRVMNSLPKDSAGLLATMSVPTCLAQATAASILEILRTNTAQFQSLDYIYVLENQMLIGVFSIHELFSAPALSIVDSFMIKDVASVHEHTDQEHVAQLALAQSIKAVPVIDNQNIFLGVVLADDILRILHDEHTEDIYKSAGIKVDSTQLQESSPLLKHIKQRTPWLFLGLLGGVAAAIIIEFFEKTVASEIAIAAFIPAIVYIGDAVGNQTEMLIVRALSRPEKISIWKYLRKEWLVGTLISLLMAVTIFALSFLWMQKLALSIVLTISVITTVWFSITIAAVLPWLFDKFGYDPAVASGPLATVTCDISSVSIYLLIASALL